MLASPRPTCHLLASLTNPLLATRNLLTSWPSLAWPSRLVTCCDSRSHTLLTCRTLPPSPPLPQASAALGCVLGFSRECWLVAPSADPLAALHAAALLLALLWAHATRRG